MAVRRDILQDTDGDLMLRDGDFVIGDSDSIHIQDTITAFPGWWKENPQDGVGISAYLKSTGQEQVLAREVKLQLENDGYLVNNPQVSITNEKLTLVPNAKRV